MNIDFKKVNTITRAVNVYIELNKSVLTNEIMDTYIDSALTFLNIKICDEELNAVKNELTYRHQIKCTDGQSLLDNYDGDDWYKKRDNPESSFFWNRYSNYLIDKKNFSPNVVSTLGNETLDRDIMNYIGNPNSEKDFFKRGLIIGDVQSGKTSTYIGLMCKAADAGYKVFILLTGTIESLRKQTQERVEEGFIGIDMSSNRANKRVGVGEDNGPIQSTSLTSRKGDFTGDRDQIAISLQNHSAVVFVIKKNSKVLTKLLEWIETTSADKLIGKVDVPMILIDDEADNASINTSKSEEDPTTINRLIRKLASLFSKSNYIGFTATPYANVFIDPISTNDMLTHDLFPENFIYALPTPSNYIGPQDTFSSNGKYYSQLMFIKDAGREEEDGFSFYFKHKKEWADELPESLTDAIYTFYIANAIRDIKGHVGSHRSMLINISRFIKVQYYTQDVVSKIHDDAYRAIKFDLDPNDLEASMKNPILKRIYENWELQYSQIEYIKWNEIAGILYEAIKEIQIKVVNSSNKEKLIYTDDYPIRVIAIGGLALSRGLTLEGLVTSYFYRNTATYDVLMQMGRWFGYRKDYDDLFRIWTHKDSAKWYAEIAEATEILKSDMREMHERGMSPKNFGIRVRDDCKELQITARNKRRNARDEYEFSSYAGKYIETPYLLSNAERNKQNYYRVVEFTTEMVKNNIKFNKLKGSGEHYTLQDIPKVEIIKLLNDLFISRYNHEFDKSQVIDYISSEDNEYINLWDVAFMDGTESENAITICGNDIIKSVRGNCSIDGERLKLGQKGKLGGPDDGKIGIVDYNGRKSLDIIEGAMVDFRNEYRKEHLGLEFKKGRKYPSNTWFKYVKDRKPVLMIYLVEISNKDESVPLEKYIENMIDPKDGKVIPSVAFAIGFPQNENVKSSIKKYKSNLYYNYFEKDENEIEIEEE